MSHSTACLRVLRAEPISVSRHAPGLREKFLAPGADLACLTYDGALGERFVAETVLLTAKGKYVTFELPADARQEFVELCVALLELRFPYWSSAEGAEGRFVWNLASDRMTHTHDLRIVREDIVEGTAPLTGESEGWTDIDIPF